MTRAIGRHLYILLLVSLLTVVACAPEPTPDLGTPTVPVAPTGATAAGGDGEVTVSWELVTDALSYNIYWATATGVTKQNGTREAGVSSPFLHTVANGSTYYYVVTAENAAGESVESLEVSALAEAAAVGVTSLVVSEVGSAYYEYSAFWFEVYNTGTAPVSLGDYSLRSWLGNYTAGYASGSIGEVTLPTVSIPAGSNLLVRSKPYTAYVNTDQVVFVEDGSGNYPFWFSGGFIELLKNGETVDFVRFGGDTTTPTTASAWGTGAAPALPSLSVADYGKSIARDGLNSDTNLAADWVSRDFATPGGPNDVTCNTDVDADGIPDCSEVSGSTFAGMPLYEWGARTGQKDVFLHVNYMNSTDPGIIPRREALEKVAAVFLGQGYTLHFDVGDLFHPAAGISPPNHDLGGGGVVPWSQGVIIGSIGDTRANLYTIKNTYMPLNRKQIFYYVLIGSSQNEDGTAGSSGLGEVNGNDFLISLGNWGLTTATTPELNRVINFQAATLMHEFGHNLGLNHGGNEDLNYKPNYISTMNYLYQLYGLPTIGNVEGDRYYFRFGSSCNGIASSTDLTNPPTGAPASFILDYSDGTGSSISELNVVESTGLGRTLSTAVDFDCSSVINDGYALNLNPLYDVTATDSFSDYNDWGAISILFQRTFYGDSTGATDPSVPRVVHDPVWHDRQPVAEEQPPPPEFFERLRREIAGKR